MRIRLFTVTLIFFIMIFHIPSGFSVSNNAQNLDLSFSQKVATEVLNLERNINRLSTDLQKLDLIEKTLLRVEKMRTQFPAQFKGDEKQIRSLMKKIEIHRKSFIGMSLFLGTAAFAKEKPRQQAAHVHGAGTLGIAFDQTKGSMEFKIPSESIFSFEHAANSAADKKAMSEGLQKLETKIAEMVVFDSSLNCQISKTQMEVVKEAGHSEHSETVASFAVSCAKSPIGTKLIFNFQKFFPRIKDLDISFLAENIQTSIEAKKNGTILHLK